MRIRNPEIDLRKYVIGSLLILGMVLYFSGDNRNYLATGIIFVASILNHYMLYQGGKLLLGIANEQKKFNAFLYFLGKTVVLAIALYFALSMAPNLVLHSMFQYIFQLIILFLSIKR